MASPQSDVRRLGTGMSRMGTPPPFKRFSADMTWCVPRKIRIISLGEESPTVTSKKCCRQILSIIIEVRCPPT